MLLDVPLLPEKGVKSAKHRLPPIDHVGKVALGKPAKRRDIIGQIQRPVLAYRHLAKTTLAIPEIGQFDGVLPVVSETGGELKRRAILAVVTSVEEHVEIISAGGAGDHGVASVVFLQNGLETRFLYRLNDRFRSIGAYHALATCPGICGTHRGCAHAQAQYTERTKHLVHFYPHHVLTELLLLLLGDNRHGHSAINSSTGRT